MRFHTKDPTVALLLALPSIVLSATSDESSNSSIPLISSPGVGDEEKRFVCTQGGTHYDAVATECVNSFLHFPISATPITFRRSGQSSLPQKIESGRCVVNIDFASALAPDDVKDVTSWMALRQTALELVYTCQKSKRVRGYAITGEQGLLKLSIFKSHDDATLNGDEGGNSTVGGNGTASGAQVVRPLSSGVFAKG